MSDRSHKWIDSYGGLRPEYDDERDARVLREEWQERIDAAHARALSMDDERDNGIAMAARVWATNHYAHHLSEWRGDDRQAIEGHRNDFHWRGGLFFARLTCGCVMIYSEVKSRRFGDGSLSWDRTTIAVVPPLEWASIIASVSAGGETPQRFQVAAAFHGVAR